MILLVSMNKNIVSLQRLWKLVRPFPILLVRMNKNIVSLQRLWKLVRPFAVNDNVIFEPQGIF